MLSTNNKLSKSNGKYLVLGLSLSPNTVSGYQTCSSSTPECRKYCINKTGLGVMSNVQAARIKKTRMFFEQREEFLKELKISIGKALKKATKLKKKLAIRLNVFSDIKWELIDPTIFTDFPTVQFYDYTKHVKRYENFLHGKLPSNYHLTFSRSEKNDGECLRFLKEYDKATINYVFMTVPKYWNGYKVTNGDTDDLRFNDVGVIGVKAKGKLKKSNSPFITLTSLVASAKNNRSN